MTLPGTVEADSPRRGRPPRTSARELELIALRLFTEYGFDATTIEQIATEAGVSERTFFRYFGSKASVLWSEFDTEVGAIRDALARTPPDVPMLEAIRRAVISANHYRAEDVPELRIRTNLIGAAPGPAVERGHALRRLGTGHQRVRRGQAGPARRFAVPARHRPDGPGRVPRRL